MDKITLRPFEDTDVELYTSWLNKDYILKWYNDPREWLDEVTARRGEYAWINHFIVMCSGAPIGFCQYYDCYNAKELWYSVARPDDFYSIDYLIGEEDFLGKGYGKELVRVLTERIRATGKANRIVVQPDEGNGASNGALRANGYQFDIQKAYFYKTLR